MRQTLGELLSAYTNTSKFKPILRYVFSAPKCCVSKNRDVWLIWGCQMSVQKCTHSTIASWPPGVCQTWASSTVSVWTS